MGSVTVSGLPQRDDHELVVEALCAMLGRDYAELKLEPEGSIGSCAASPRYSSRSISAMKKPSVVQAPGKQSQRAFRRKAFAQPLRAGVRQNSAAQRILMVPRKRNLPRIAVSRQHRRNDLLVLFRLQRTSGVNDASAGPHRAQRTRAESPAAARLAAPGLPVAADAESPDCGPAFQFRCTAHRPAPVED